jgi:hypothetical protein
MRIFLAVTVFAIACGSAPKKKDDSIVQGAEVSPTCCCKTLPTTAEKEIVPVYTMTPRMECSGAHGDCVDDVQCNAAAEGGGETPASSSGDGNPPPPPDLPPSP